MNSKVEVEDMGVFEYLMLALVLLALVAIVILIIIVLQKKQVKVETPLDLEMHNKMTILQAKVEELNKDLSAKVQLTLAENAKVEIASDAENNKKLGEEISKRLGELNRQVQEALVGANKAQADTLTNLGKQIQALQTANMDVIKLGETVNNLSKIIKGDNQKRGKFGEFMLGSVLDNVFEENRQLYSTQYRITIGGNTIQPDAVIYLPRDKGNMLFIDAKFPYANFPGIFNEQGEEVEDKLKVFKKDVKTVIDKIADTYIIKGTTIDYALCYFPSDEIYNFIHTRLTDMALYARKKSVVLVSPATLQPVLFTIKDLMIEFKRSEKLNDLNTQIINLAKDFNTLNGHWTSLEKTITNLGNQAHDFGVTYNRLNGKFAKISNADETSED